MKKIITAAILSLSILPLGLQAATEINRNSMKELISVGKVSVEHGTLDELTQKIAYKAQTAGAEYFRITSSNLDQLGYATAILYNDAV